MSMELAFFGLEEAPFTPSPNPRFLHLTPALREALAQLLHGVRERKGFILLTGEVGTGKTTLIRALRQRLDDATAIAFVNNSILDFEGILEYMLEDLGISKPEQASPARRLFALQNFLVERHRAGQNTALVLDEAQDLAPHTLEQIRLLSNFETTSEKILQILLVGQPELRAKLDLPQLRQLKQRIGLRCRISPLTPEQVHDYVRTRLRVAGAHDLGLFSPAALARVAQQSGGIPRLVNTICDHCLLFAYADQVRRIGPDIVEEAVSYLEDGERPRSMRSRLLGHWRMTRFGWTSLAACAAAATGMLAYPDTAWRTLDLVVSSVSGLAHSVRALLPL